MNAIWEKELSYIIQSFELAEFINHGFEPVICVI